MVSGTDAPKIFREMSADKTARAFEEATSVEPSLNVRWLFLAVLACSGILGSQGGIDDHVLEQRDVVRRRFDLDYEHSLNCEYKIYIREIFNFHVIRGADSVTPGL